MPIEYELDVGERLIRTRCVGEVKFSDVVDHFREVAAIDSLPRGLDVLLDLTSMANLPEGGQMRSVAVEVEGLRERVDFGVWAVAADRDALYGMIRMLRVFVEPVVQDVGVFRSVDEASRWLESARAPLV